MLHSVVGVLGLLQNIPGSHDSGASQCTSRFLVEILFLHSSPTFLIRELNLTNPRTVYELLVHKGVRVPFGHLGRHLTPRVCQRPAQEFTH